MHTVRLNRHIYAAAFLVFSTAVFLMSISLGSSRALAHAASGHAVIQRTPSSRRPRLPPTLRAGKRPLTIAHSTNALIERPNIGLAAPATTLPFAADSVWNAPLSPSAALDPNSAIDVSELSQQVAKYQPWINTTSYSSPVFTVNVGQPTVQVTLDKSSPALQASWMAVPIPATARAAAGSDEHMVVWQPSTDTMWEFWHMHLVAGSWHAAWGGTMTSVSTSPGYFTSPSWWGATATSLPLLAGLIRPSELASGQIDHALALAIPLTRSQSFTWPAQRTDGRTSDPLAIQEGQRFRVDPTLDLSKIPMVPIVRMMAVAAQKYGIIVRDTSGSVSFYADDTAAEGLPDPYHGAGGWFGNQYVNNLLQNFPWSHLQALKDS